LSKDAHGKQLMDNKGEQISWIKKYILKKLISFVVTICFNDYKILLLLYFTVLVAVVRLKAGLLTPLDLKSRNFVSVGNMYSSYYGEMWPTGVHKS
jgi:hypothetical protein